MDFHYNSHAFMMILVLHEQVSKNCYQIVSYSQAHCELNIDKGPFKYMYCKLAHQKHPF